MLENIKVILWDFDGVLMDSNAVRDHGFEKVLEDFPRDEVDELLVFHRKNGGLSRYVKFRYFFEQIRNETVSDVEIQNWADRFSVIMKGLLVNPALLIHDTINFIEKFHKSIPMHIVSGSDQTELRFLCKELRIDRYFISVNGSPTPKKDLITKLLMEYNYNPKETVMIGDALNDLDAARANNTRFIGYNNTELIATKCEYCYQFSVD